MKKVLKILCVVLVISLGVSLAACSKNANETDISQTEETQINTEHSEITTENQTQFPVSDEYDDYEAKTTEMHYNHSAIQGCIIAEQDGSPMVQYSEKCESCGYISPSKQTIYHYMDSYTTSFLCPQCGNTQMVEINTNTY
ncbi:MAG: hypothetical protein K2F65_06595 [Eubacterium sp.]|nr:hypothetical protein [Eubacterium sp.]